MQGGGGGYSASAAGMMKSDPSNPSGGVSITVADSLWGLIQLLWASTMSETFNFDDTVFVTAKLDT